MPLISKFWDEENIKLPQINDKLIELAENKLGFKLPKLFIELLKIQNGGHTKGFVFPMNVETTWSKNHIPFDEMYGISIDSSVSSALSILDTEYLTQEWQLPEKQVVLCGDGHWWITLDYRKSGIPTISWIDVECQEEVQVADSFEDFFNGLVLAKEFDYED
jgi:hypothetical protein